MIFMELLLKSVLGRRSHGTFKVGGAAGTVAKTMSAYDMAVSDSIYGRGESGRYVCEERLQRMLNREFSLLENRLRQDRPSTQFFAFANTVAASSFKTKVLVMVGWEYDFKVNQMNYQAT